MTFAPKATAKAPDHQVGGRGASAEGRRQDVGWELVAQSVGGQGSPAVWTIKVQSDNNSLEAVMKNYGSCAVMRWNANTESLEQFRTKKSLVEAAKSDGGIMGDEIWIEVLTYGEEFAGVTRSERRYGGYHRKGYTREWEEMWDDNEALRGDMIRDGEYVVCGPDARLNRKWWVTLTIEEGFVTKIDGTKIAGREELVQKVRLMSRTDDGIAKWFVENAR